MGIPVGVEYDDSVSRLEIEAETASPSAEQEDEELGVLGIELGEEEPSVVGLGRPVQSQVGVA